MKSDRIKQAQPDHPVLGPIARRWSPYALDPTQPVEDEKLLACLEAARWAASSFNEQPWRFIITRREDKDEFDKALGCLVEANRQWARRAGVLIITAVKRAFTKNDKPNRVAEHDLGLAAAHLTLQAVEQGLHVHQMAGIDQDAARRTYHIPEGYDPWTGIAIGHAADPDTFEDRELAERDVNPRTRKPLVEIVFAGRWEQPAPLVGG